MSKNTSIGPGASAQACQLYVELEWVMAELDHIADEENVTLREALGAKNP
jgi:hypothetical protein